MILLLHKIDILKNKTFIEERNIRKKVTKFSSHDEVTHFDGIILIHTFNQLAILKFVTYCTFIFTTYSRYSIHIHSNSSSEELMTVILVA